MGSLSKVDVFDEICQSFESRPIYCDAIVSDDDPAKWDLDIDTGLIKYTNSLQRDIQDSLDKDGINQGKTYVGDGNSGLIAHWYQKRLVKITLTTVLIILLSAILIYFFT